MIQRKRVIAVIGDAALAPEHHKAALAERLGELIIDEGWRVMTGGLGGVMEAACRGAHRSRAYQTGDTVGILPGTDPDTANPFVDIAIPTGLDHGRNLVVAQADAVVAIGGGAGTLAELAFAWIMKRPAVAFRVEGWSGRLADMRLDDRVRYPEIPDDRVYGAGTAEEAIALLRERMPRYDARHHGVRRR
jgi:hypothetical protein